MVRGQHRRSIHRSRCTIPAERYVSEYREYENGVADVLAFLTVGEATIERDVHMPGRNSGIDRQIDIVARGRVFGISDATLVVDCKRWASVVDVADVGSFIDMVEDVGADFGLLMVASGASEAARTRAKRARGIRVEVLTIEELEAWQPPGTLSAAFRLPASQQATAQAALRRKGFRTRVEQAPGQDNEIVLVAIRHYGANSDSGENQGLLRRTAREALAHADIEAVDVSMDITIKGGTPGHQWLEVTFGGMPVGVRVLAASEAELVTELNRVAVSLGLPRDQLDVVRPDGWLVTQLFGLP